MNQESRVDDLVVQHPCHGPEIQIPATKKLHFEQFFRDVVELAATSAGALFSSQQVLAVPGNGLI